MNNNESEKVSKESVEIKQPLLVRIRPYLLLTPAFLLTPGILIPFAMAILFLIKIVVN